MLKNLMVLGLLLPLCCNGVDPIPTLNHEKINQWSNSLQNLEIKDLHDLEDLLKKYNDFAKICIKDRRCLVSREGKKQKKELLNSLKIIKKRPAAATTSLVAFIELFKSEVWHETLGEKKAIALSQDEINQFVFRF